MEQQAYEPIRFNFRHHSDRSNSQRSISFSSKSHSRRLKNNNLLKERLWTF